MGKIGDGHFSAMGRQGLRELRAGLYPQSNIAGQTEHGIYGTKTPGEVAKAREGEAERDEEPPTTSSLLESRVQKIEGHSQSKQREKGLER